MRNIKTPLALTVAIAALGASLYAVAAEADPRPKMGARLFERLDQNQDGVIDSTERATLQDARLRRADENRDGVVSDQEQQRAEELAVHRDAIRQATLERRFRQLDADSDGTVTQEEFLNAHRPPLERADADGNGVITREEFDAAIATGGGGRGRFGHR